MLTRSHRHTGQSMRVGELVMNLALKQLRSSYKNSFIGFGWSLISPVVTILVYAAVFSLILKGRATVGDPSGLTSYGLFLASAIIPWQFSQIAITAQNHNFAVDIASIADEVELTHVNLYDHTVEGMRHRRLPIFSVQYHPEAAPGPHDANPLFAQFVQLMANA